MLALDLRKGCLANKAFSGHVYVVTYTGRERVHSWTRPGIPLSGAKSWKEQGSGSEWTGSGPG